VDERTAAAIEVHGLAGRGLKGEAELRGRMRGMDLRIATCMPLPEVDVDEELLLRCLREHGVRARMVAWNDPTQEWEQPLPTLLRSTWDYFHDLPAFRAWLARVHAAAPLWNPLAVVESNLHKDYLLALEARGVAVVPTELLRRGGEPALEPLLRRRGWRRFVLKPAVGAGSFVTRRFEAAELEAGEAFLREQLALRDMLVQPFLDSVDGHGERALVWIDGEFTHAVRKTPRFSGQDERVSAALPLEADERALGEQALAPLREQLLYARVDVARDAGGRVCVMELELVEPSLFLRQSPPALQRLGAALARRLG